MYGSSPRETSISYRIFSSDAEKELLRGSDSIDGILREGRLHVQAHMLFEVDWILKKLGQKSVCHLALNRLELLDRLRPEMLPECSSVTSPPVAVRHEAKIEIAP